jgi:hypothetical protein
MKGSEVKPQHEGDDVTWKDVIHAIRPLWTLKFSDNAEYQQLYQYLLLVKEWRNNEAHVSPTASEQEINAAINIIITMYFFATGSCITDLEMEGHNIEEVTSCNLKFYSIIEYNMRDATKISIISTEPRLCLSYHCTSVSTLATEALFTPF